MLDVLIATPLADDLVQQIREAGLPLTVRHDAALVPPPRYPSDHRGDPNFRRSAEQEQRWRSALADAHVFFGVPGDDPDALSAAVHGGSPRLRFVQATAAGAGEQVAAAGLDADDLDRVAVASSSGVHAGPLSEFALLGLLAFARGLPRLEADRSARRWPHYATTELSGRTVLVLGVGAIGAQVARLAKAVGMSVIGVNRSGNPPDAPVDELATADRLADAAARADALVITTPATPETRGEVGERVLRALRPGAIVVNVGRGAVVDEPALIRALQDGHLAGAALDVTASEPPPRDSPLWTLPNVLLSPHTAALSPRENERIVELFADNLHRLIDGRPIRNRITAQRSY